MGVSREGQREKERKRWTFDKVRDRKKFKRGGGSRLLERISVADGIKVEDFWSDTCIHRRPFLPRITIRKHLTKKTGLRDTSGCGCELISDG